MQLGRLLEEVYRSCGLQVFRRIATGGSTTHVEDTGIINRRGDGYYSQGSNGGHILFLSQTTDGLAPQGQFKEVSGFVSTTSTPTFSFSSLTAAAGIGDIYALMKPTIQLYEMIGCINDGLRRLPPLELTDTSLNGIASTLKYNLPLTAGAYELLGIEIGNDTDGWKDTQGYSITPKSGSTQHQLIFTQQPPYDSTTAANQTFKIRYLAKHPALSIYSDYVEKAVPDELAIAICTEAAWELLMRKKPGWYADKTKMTIFQDVQRRSAQAQANNPIRIKPGVLPRRINLTEL